MSEQDRINAVLVELGILPVSGAYFPVKLDKPTRRRLAVIGAQAREGRYYPPGS